MKKEKIVPVFDNVTTTSESAVFYDIPTKLTSQKEFPEQPLGNRIIVKPRQANTKYKKVNSGIVGSDTVFYKADDSEILLDEQQLANIIREIELTPQLVDVVAVGTDVGLPSLAYVNSMDNVKIKVSDIVRVYLNQCSAKITIDEIDYLVYSETNVISKVI